MKGFSEINLRYTERFYRLFPEKTVPQVEGEIGDAAIRPQVEGEIMPRVGGTNIHDSLEPHKVHSGQMWRQPSQSTFLRPGDDQEQLVSIVLQHVTDVLSITCPREP